MVLNTNEEYWPGNPERLLIKRPSSSTMTCLPTFANADFAFSFAISSSESDWISTRWICEKLTEMFLVDSIDRISRNLF